VRAADTHVGLHQQDTGPEITLEARDGIRERLKNRINWSSPACDRTTLLSSFILAVCFKFQFA
jgi:hypothetical protein